jgi:hypothetical protein
MLSRLDEADSSPDKIKYERRVTFWLTPHCPRFTSFLTMAPSTPSSQPSKGEQDLSDSPHEEEKKSDENQKGVNWHETLENASDAEGEDDEEQKSPPMSVPIVSLSSGLKQKASPLELHSWVSLALTLDGRDKVTKVCQYMARTLAWWYAGTNQAQRFNALKVSLTNSRKAYRLGRSLIEFHRLRSMGLIETLGWHLQQHAEGDEPPNPKTLFRRASSNIGWGPVTLEESQPSKRRLLRSLSSVAYRMYRPMASTLSVSGEASKEPSTPMWKLVGSAIKMLGLFGFWTGDNIAFLTQSGMFDDYRQDAATRMAMRKQWQTRASETANRCYFAGAVAGLVTSLRSYLNYRNNTIRALKQQVDQAEDEDEKQVATESLETAEAKQFVLFLALAKSCCDVLVFSNNPGIDFWKKRTGRKMHEGLHCLCGLISASTVIYNNFPNANK